MTRTINAPCGPVTLSFQGRCEIETRWDYAYVRSRTAARRRFQTSIDENENGQNFGNGITRNLWIDPESL